MGSEMCIRDRTKSINPIDYKIPGDISSAAFFIVLTIFLKLNVPFLYSMLISLIATGILYWLYINLLNRLGLSL